MSKQISNFDFIVQKREDLDYQIVVPSRKRSQRIQTVFSFFPQAHIWVHQSQREEYLKVVPENQLKLHKEYGLANIRAEMILRTPNKCVIMIDDDLDGLTFCQGEKTRKTKDANYLRAVMENQIQICYDLDIKCFGWNTNPNPMYYSSIRPFSFTSIPLAIWGVIGKDIVPDRRLKWYGQQMDVVLQNLLKNRIIIRDNRFVYTCGQITGKNAGGAQGMRTSRDCEEDYKLLRKKWGRYAICGINAKEKSVAQNANTYKINVSRKSVVVKEE